MKLDHLFALADDNAVFQHAKYSVPARKEGYTVDDNARSLVFAAKAHSLWPSRRLAELQQRLVSFLLLMQAEDGRFHNFMDFSQRIVDEPSVGDHLGRALWAAGTVINSGLPRGVRASARLMFDRALPWARASSSPRTRAYACLGIYERLHEEQHDSNLTANLKLLADSLVRLYESNRSGAWEWFENVLSYDNPRLSQALFLAHQALRGNSYLLVAERTLSFLAKVTSVNGLYAPIGNRGWFLKGQERALYDQQPVEAGAMVEATTIAYKVTHSATYKQALRCALGWFFGLNTKSSIVYDASTGACYDGLSESGLNENQGAESTVAFLLAAATFIENLAPG